MRLAWLTDLHLNFLSRRKLAAFVEETASTRPDAFLLGGDISDADTVIGTLEMLSRAWKVPIYFVLGNHDFYHGSIKVVREEVAQLVERVPGLIYLGTSAPIHLSASTVLLGADGWGDCAFGNAATSSIHLNDFTLIEELYVTPRGPQQFAFVQTLGRESADHLRTVLTAVLPTAEKFIVLTHVPPFREAT